MTNQVRKLISGLGLAGLVAGYAQRRGSLSCSGAIAATPVGALAFASGWPSTRALLTFFVTSSALSHLPRSGEPQAPRRTAVQVLANGGAASLAWIARLAGLPGPWDRLIFGSLAAAAADTWATEVGQRWGGRPRLITNGRPVSAGESGGITLLGSLASAGGASALALASSGRADIAAITLAGVLGSLVDSCLGASLQARYSCPGCGSSTERGAHCGQPARLVRGYAWMTNDAVNALATSAAGMLCLALSIHQAAKHPS